MEDFYKLHISFTVAYFLEEMFKKYVFEEIFYSAYLMNTLAYVFLFIEACTAHKKNHLERKYSILTVEDNVHFFVVLEIVTFATTFFIVMAYLLQASIRN